MAARIVFAIPGDLEARTGGYLYDRRLAEGLRAAGRHVDVLNLGPSFPHPTPADMQVALAALAAVPRDRLLLIDGLAYGAFTTDGLHAVQAPICALVHHPLALESGLAPERAAALHALEAANLSLARRVVVTSPHTAAALARDFGVPAGRITVALPGTDRPTRPRRPQVPPLILAVGSLTARKGHDVLLAALARLTDLAWQAEIVGGRHDAAVAERLLAQRVALGLDMRVRFVGEMDTESLHGRYSRASLFALATRYEGYGMVFAEATAHGLPIVSCSVGAVPDTAPAASSLLVPPDDPPAFAAALRSVLADPAAQDRLAAAALRAAASLPDWPETVRRVAGALDEAAA